MPPLQSTIELFNTIGPIRARRLRRAVQEAQEIADRAKAEAEGLRKKVENLRQEEEEAHENLLAQCSKHSPATIDFEGPALFYAEELERRSEASEQAAKEADEAEKKLQAARQALIKKEKQQEGMLDHLRERQSRETSPFDSLP